MSSKSRINARVAALAAVAGLGAFIGGCSDIYYDRRETIALGADDHIAANQAIQMIDPWPRYVGNKNIAFNGERAQGAVERYRRHNVIRPINPVTTTTLQPSPPPPVTTDAIVMPASASNAPAAPVK